MCVLVWVKWVCANAVLFVYCHVYNMYYGVCVSLCICSLLLGNPNLKDPYLM